MNYQFAKPIEYRAIRNIFESTRQYYASKIRIEVLVPFHLKCLSLIIN